MSARAFFCFLLMSALVLTGFALLWLWIAPYYGQLQIALLQFWIGPELRLALDQEGIVVHSQERLLMRRDFLSLGGLGLTLALWLATPRLRGRERLGGLALGWALLFIAHLLVFIGLLAFAQAVAEGRATGWQTLLYSFIAVSDWVLPVLIWRVLAFRLWGHAVDRDLAS
ncbi:hypothetical protein LM602_01000 [Candidatus Acetothermia bacterium]|jgi:hypothetical protein|nr:hypothetical protein [Candidatus Acetothermia bacterium]MCI2431123.1 hypothetical protein [Candidatus Acetothermia bacterium]MCI2437215.1 hypothetical protein [Candidatus Acetothermia bacterium]